LGPARYIHSPKVKQYSILKHLHTLSLFFVGTFVRLLITLCGHLRVDVSERGIDISERRGVGIHLHACIEQVSLVYASIM
jgi:hypothetical protein